MEMEMEIAPPPNSKPNQLCPVCSHLQQPPTDEDTRTISSVSSSNVDPTQNFPHSTLQQAPRLPPLPAPAPNQVPQPLPHASATDLPSSSPNPHPNCPLMHKNKLQEYAQRCSLPLPEYTTVNEGPHHAPRFRSSVIVGGRKYTSANAFSRRKAAEQDVARISMESIFKNVKQEGSSSINRICGQDTVVCKSILNEFAVKMNMSRPTYNTVQPRVSIPIFASSLVLNGTTYTGGPGQNKEEAEWLAAWAAILSLMGNSGFETVLSEVIMSKDKLFEALYKAKDLNHADTVFGLEGVNANAGSDSQDREIKPQATSVPAPIQQVSAVPQAHTSSHHEFKVPKQETSPMETTEFVLRPFIAFVPQAQRFTGLVQVLGKRKNRERKKANKKVRARV